MVKKTKSKKKKIHPIQVSSYEEAEKIIYEQIKAEKNPREISQMEFIINGVSKKHNPQQIRKIKEKFEPKDKSDNTDSDTALLFELFSKDIRPEDAVIQTKFYSKFVKQVWEEYLDMVGKETIPKEVIKKLFEYGSTEIRPCDTFDKLLRACDGLVESAKELERFYYPCRICDAPVILKEGIITSTIQWMQSQWVCSEECVNKKEEPEIVYF